MRLFLLAAACVPSRGGVALGQTAPATTPPPVPVTAPTTPATTAPMAVPGVTAPLQPTSEPLPPPAPTAFDLPQTRPALSTPLVVSSPSIRPPAPIPKEFSAYGKNVSPVLTWSAGPKATKAYVLIVQDVDFEDPRPATNWLAYDIPATVLTLPPRMRNTPAPNSPLGMLQGWNFHGSVGYSGPRPPVGDPPHHYHFQVFAMNRRLGLGGGARLPQVLRAMSGHVLARGELVAVYAEAAPKPPRATPTATEQP